MNDKLIVDGNLEEAKRHRQRRSPSGKTASAAGADRPSPVLNPRGTQRVTVPTIYLWDDDANGLICGAFYWQKQPWGLCFPRSENRTRREIDQKHLRVRLRDSLDVLIHHGAAALEDVRQLRNAEADRYWNDRLWAQRVNAFKKVVLFKEISKAEAEKLKLL